MPQRMTERQWSVVVEGLSEEGLEHVVWRGWRLVPHTITLRFRWKAMHAAHLLIEVGVWGTDVTDETSFTAHFAQGPGAVDSPLEYAPQWVRDLIDQHRPELPAVS